MTPLTRAEVEAIVGRITVPDLSVEVIDINDLMFLRVWQMAPNNDTGNEVLKMDGNLVLVEWQHSANDVIRMAFKACLSYLEHEFRERFRYDGVAVLHAHPDVEWIAQRGGITMAQTR